MSKSVSFSLSILLALLAACVGPPSSNELLNPPPKKTAQNAPKQEQEPPAPPAAPPAEFNAGELPSPKYPKKLAPFMDQAMSDIGAKLGATLPPCARNVEPKVWHAIILLAFDNMGARIPDNRYDGSLDVFEDKGYEWRYYLWASILQGGHFFASKLYPAADEFRDAFQCVRAGLRDERVMWAWGMQAIEDYKMFPLSGTIAYLAHPLTRRFWEATSQNFPATAGVEAYYRKNHPPYPCPDFWQEASDIEDVDAEQEDLLACKQFPHPVGVINAWVYRRWVENKRFPLVARVLLAHVAAAINLPEAKQWATAVQAELKKDRGDPRLNAAYATAVGALQTLATNP